MTLNNYKIGTRLGSGFAILLLLLALMMTIGIWRLNAANEAMREMMATPLAKERLAEELSRNVAVGVVRGKAIAKNADGTLEALFSAEAKVSTARGNEILKSIDALLASPEERELMADIQQTRKHYLTTRDSMMAFKKAGNSDEATQLFESDFVPISATYIGKMQKFVDFQRKAIDLAAADIDANAARGRLDILAVGGFALVAGVVIALLLTRSITRPIGGATRLAARIAGGDLSKQSGVTGKDEVAQLMQSLQTMNASLFEMVLKVRESADSIHVASGEVAAGNQDLSQRTEQTASNLQQAASSMEQLTGTVKQSADSARQANQLAANAADVAARGGDAVAEVVATMEGINQSSKKIADIIGVIDSIAFQTNILALNAAVEAARAGEQGRGFAVVASEVRSLAHRSADAAKEIKALIGASVVKVEGGTRLVTHAGATMAEIVSSVRSVSHIIGEITAASSEQSDGIEHVNVSVNQLDQMTQQNAALVEQSAAAAESLREQAVRLGQVVAAFNLGEKAVA